MAIPLMLITLGVAIAAAAAAGARARPLALPRQARDLRRGAARPRASPSACRGSPSAVLVLQVATPVAVTSYMLAAKYDARPDEVAGLVVVSTLVSVPAIPLILAFFV